jgi:hypothetical protein
MTVRAGLETARPKKVSLNASWILRGMRTSRSMIMESKLHFVLRVCPCHRSRVQVMVRQRMISFRRRVRFLRSASKFLSALLIPISLEIYTFHSRSDF